MQNSDLAARAFSDATQYNTRPSYSREKVQKFLNKFGFSKNTQDIPQSAILELGAGTGKFTVKIIEVLKGSNVKIIASDPKENMCQKFRQSLPDIKMYKFPAQQIDLPNESVHGVVAANALHWFSESQKSFDEINRVLVPRGMFGVFWYNPDFRIPWIADVGKYLEPLYEQQGTLLYPLHKEHFIEPAVRQSRYFEREEDARYCSLWHANNDEAVLNMFLTSAVFTASDEKTIREFKLFFQKIIDKHFTSKKEALTTVPFEETMVWFRKRQ